MTLSPCPLPQGSPSSTRGAALAGVATLTSLFLAACGGDSNAPAVPPPPPPAVVTQVPASAAGSDMALESFAFMLAQTDDTEPLTLDLLPANLPTSESEEPIATP